MNTVWADRHGMHDALADGEAVAAWLRAVAPRLAAPAPGGPLTAAQVPVQEARRLRDALRRLAATVTGDGRGDGTSSVPDPATAVAIVNEACAAAPSWSALQWNGSAGPTRAVRSASGTGVCLLSQIAEEAVRLFATPGGADLRACHAPGCVLYFLATRPRREWCSAGCGNRARVARHYRRHHRSAPPDGDPAGTP